MTDDALRNEFARDFKRLIDAMNAGDYMIILPWLMVTVAFVILFNLVADIMYAFLDPRIRYA